MNESAKFVIQEKLLQLIRQLVHTVRSNLKGSSNLNMAVDITYDHHNFCIAQV